MSKYRTIIMKYGITTLKKEVPDNIRLKVYKEALKGKEILDYGLCIILPMILFDLTNGLDYYKNRHRIESTNSNSNE